MIVAYCARRPDELRRARGEHAREGTPDCRDCYAIVGIIIRRGDALPLTGSDRITGRGEGEN